MQHSELYSVLFTLSFLGIHTVVCIAKFDDDDAPVVRTVYGDVRGIQANRSLQFLGIPYASPPTGELRWVKPIQPSVWGPSVLNTTQRKPACPQKFCTHFLPNTSCPIETSEDCLYLNVWTPLDATGTSVYPVMVFMHGGAFKWGSASNRVYDGNNLAHDGKVVIVNIEYRLGLLGFLYTGDTPVDAKGNYGIQDQRLALQWVQLNIARFGGDPNKVTIFGQSAGAQSVFIHMMSPKSEGLFRAAIIESAPFALAYRDKPEALLLSRKVREVLRCKEKEMACLRSKSVEEINDAQREVTFKITGGKLYEYYEPFGPIIDGDELTLQPMDAAKAGAFSKIPVMLGTVTEEGRLFVYGAWNRSLTRTEYESALAIMHPTDFRSVEQHYPPLSQPDLRDELSQLVTDYLFTCATRNVSQNLVKHGVNKTYLYVFDHANSGRGGWGKDTFCEGHVCHAEELGFVFQNTVVGIPTQDERILSEVMAMFWTNFAHNLNPNVGIKSPTHTWPVHSPGPNQQNLMYFETPVSQAVLHYRQTDCDFWDKLGYVQ